MLSQRKHIPGETSDELQSEQHVLRRSRSELLGITSDSGDEMPSAFLDAYRDVASQDIRQKLNGWSARDIWSVLNPNEKQVFTNIADDVKKYCVLIHQALVRLRQGRGNGAHGEQTQ